MIYFVFSLFNAISVVFKNALLLRCVCVRKKICIPEISSFGFDHCKTCQKLVFLGFCGISKLNTEVDTKGADKYQHEIHAFGSMWFPTSICYMML